MCKKNEIKIQGKIVNSNWEVNSNKEKLINLDQFNKNPWIRSLRSMKIQCRLKFNMAKLDNFLLSKTKEYGVRTEEW